MNLIKDSYTVLMADDDVDEFFLLKEGLIASRIDCDLRHVMDGDELMDYLQGQGVFTRSGFTPRPTFILLDLNMPKKNGLEVLLEIKSNPEFKHIPVIVYSTSMDEDDIRRSYALGANSYINKPDDWDQLINMIVTVFPYWTQIVNLPGV